MAVTCFFFAQSADWMKRRELALSVPHPVPLIEVLEGRPEFAPLLIRRSILKVSVNRVMADYSTEVCDGDEIAFFPPFSGG